MQRFGLTRQEPEPPDQLRRPCQGAPNIALGSARLIAGT